MRRFLFAALACVVLGYAAILAGVFLVHAIEAVKKYPSLTGEIGLAIGVVIAGLGILLAGVRYFLFPFPSRLSDLPRQKEPHQ